MAEKEMWELVASLGAGPFKGGEPELVEASKKALLLVDPAGRFPPEFVDEVVRVRNEIALRGDFARSTS